MGTRVQGVEPGTSRRLLPELGELPGHLLWRAAARVSITLGDTLPPGVDMHAYAVLLALADGSPRSQQAIADSILISGTTMVKVAADLAGRGLVERVRNPDDRRSYALTRTAAGTRTADAWASHANELETAIAPGLSAGDRRELAGLLHVLVEPDLARDTPPPVRHSLGFLITRAHARLHREFLALLAPLGIEPRHFASLVALTATGPVSQAELARSLGLSGASVVQIVDDLEERGLVERHRGEVDRRTQTLHLLPAAAGLLARAHPMVREASKARLVDLGPRRTNRLVLLLQVVVTTG